MTKSEKAILQMENWANDNSHGYDQNHRWGPDYDCSSSVIQAWELAGVPVKSNGATYTGNMYDVFIKCGFEDITNKVNLNTGRGLKRSDVLLNIVHHVAMFCGNGMEVEASINEFGGITGGQTGDQTGREFLIKPYHNYPWDKILRYKHDSAKEPKFKRKNSGTCTGEGVNVRYTPNGLIIGQLYKGNRFDVDGKVEGDWVHIKVANFGIGYIHKDYIKLDETKSSTTKKPNITTVKKEEPKKTNNTNKKKSNWNPIGTATCTGNCVRVRKTPGGKIMGDLYLYNRFEIDGKDKGEWIHVKVANIGIGYIHRDFVKYD